VVTVAIRRLWGVTAVIFLLAGATWEPSANGQSTQQEIAARLIGQPLYLRGLWAGDDLKFTADGQPETATATVSFTEAGIDVHSVALKPGSLVIEGQRAALEFVSTDTIQRVPAKAKGYSGKVRLEIESDASGDYGKALAAIFTSDLTTLASSLPSYWQSYAKGHFCELKLAEQDKEKKDEKASADAGSLNATARPPCLQAESDASAAAPAAVGGGKAKHVGGPVKPPKVLRTSDPSFTPLARAKRYSGVVEVYLIVEKDGSVSHVSVVKPAGLGLDEAAVAAVEKYQFMPATVDGNPVAVDLYIDVNFRIF
jgi:TonB family protein